VYFAKEYQILFIWILKAPAKGEKTLKKLYPLILECLTALCFSTAVIIAAVYITLRFTPLYKFDIKYLNIENSSKLSREQLTNNYKTIIEYLNNPSIEVLNLSDLKISNNAQIHFLEVRHIFISLKYIFFCCIFIGMLLAIFLNKKKLFNFYKYTTLCLTILPIILSVPFFINFDKSFTIFHKLFFKNGYWEFDPVIDPVINTLPQEFFFHCSLLILTIILLISGSFALIYRRYNLEFKIKNLK